MITIQGLAWMEKRSIPSEYFVLNSESGFAYIFTQGHWIMVIWSWIAETWVLTSEFIFLIFLNSWALKFSSSLLTTPIIRNESPKAYHLVQFQKNLIHRFRDKFKKPTIYWWFKGQVKLAQFQKNLIHRFREKFKEVDFGPKMAHFGHKNFL